MVSYNLIRTLKKEPDMAEKLRRKAVRFLERAELLAQKYRLRNLDKLQKECSHDLIVEFITSGIFEFSERFCVRCFSEEVSLFYNLESRHKRLTKHPMIVIINNEQNPRPKFDAVKSFVKSVSIDQNNIKEVLDRISDIIEN
ncbi:MAG: hypothetical protein AAB824_02050 [Patescibacteria group bacterium]